jgi:glycine dehydrogenase
MDKLGKRVLQNTLNCRMGLRYGRFINKNPKLILHNMRYSSYYSNIVSHNNKEISDIGKKVGVSSLDDLIKNVYPEQLHKFVNPNFKTRISETEFQSINSFNNMMKSNLNLKNLRGEGYYNVDVPDVIKTNILNNPSWYTAYTPYQSEISQGRLEMIHNYQNIISILTGLPLSNAGLLDESNASCEALSMIKRSLGKKDKRDLVLIDKNLFPVVLDNLKFKCHTMSVDYKMIDFMQEEEIIFTKLNENKEQTFAIITQNPNHYGNTYFHQKINTWKVENNVKLILGTDLLYCIGFNTIKNIDADVVYGNSQRMGLPMGYGGPHTGFFSTKIEHLRFLPGKLVSQCKTYSGKDAYRMALQNREQHVKKEKATSNICTSQVLLSILNAGYIMFNGFKELQFEALRIYYLNYYLTSRLYKLGLQPMTTNIKYYFDTNWFYVNPEYITDIESFNYNMKCYGYHINHDIREFNGEPHLLLGINTSGFSNINEVDNFVNDLIKECSIQGYNEFNFLKYNEHILSEFHKYFLEIEISNNDARNYVKDNFYDITSKVNNNDNNSNDNNSNDNNSNDNNSNNNNDNLTSNITNIFNRELLQKSNHNILPLNSGMTETELMRYLKKLENKDYTLTEGMIPLGSCTMKQNSSFSLSGLGNHNFVNSHPYEDIYDTLGTHKMINYLENTLIDLTGMDNISFQSCSGAMGEYSALLAIKDYHLDKIGCVEYENNINQYCFIPESAHGTNFASAIMAGFKVVKVKNTRKGYIDYLDLEKKINDIESKNSNSLEIHNISCMMITYPSTFGFFDENIINITDLIHQKNGIIYMDGANMNAMTGIIKPGDLGMDVCHLNLHKTFSIPHGGGGPGMGPICYKDKLTPYVVNHRYDINNNDKYNSNSIISKRNDSETTLLFRSIASSPYSSASILSIPFHYLNTLSNSDLKDMSSIAILNANYLKCCLQDYYTIKFSNKKGFVAHEFIIDTSEFKKLGITENDIAKRMMDYYFHPPTMSWPIASCLMIEPTESESKEELDRFVDSMIMIRKEITEIEEGKYSKENNVFKNAPHSMNDLMDWQHPYSPEKGVYPLPILKNIKHRIPINRVNDTENDKKLLDMIKK